MLSASLFGAVPRSAAWFPGGMEVTAWAVGALVNSESTQDPGPWCHSWQEGTQGHFWIMGVVPVLPVLEANLKAGGDSGLHRTLGECSSLPPLFVVSPKRAWKAKVLWKTRCSPGLCNEFSPPGWFRVFLGRM